MSEKKNCYNETDTKIGLSELAKKIKELRKTNGILDKKLYEEILSEPSRGCEKCNYTGMIKIAEETYKPCECLLEDTLKTKMRLAGLREVYYDIDRINDEGLQVLRVKVARNPDGTVKRDKNNNIITKDEIVEDINKFVNNYKDPEKLKLVREKGIDLIIEGPVGTGKTTLVHIIGKYALRFGYSVLFTEMQKLRNIWLKKDSELSEFELRLKENADKVDFLIIDDLGNEYIGNSGAQLYEVDLLLRVRKSKKLVTIITTNLPEETLEKDVVDIRKKYNERIASLLKERRIYLIMYRTSDIREEQDDIADFLFG